MQAYMRSLVDPTKYVCGGQYTDLDSVELLPGFEWVLGEPQNLTPHRIDNPIGQLQELIQVGQSQLASILPEDIQKNVLDLFLAVKNYYENNRPDFVRATIIDFSIPLDRLDVGEIARGIIETMRSQMLELFPE